jgi:hypothetical protein
MYDAPGLSQAEAEAIDFVYVFGNRMSWSLPGMFINIEPLRA